MLDIVETTGQRISDPAHKSSIEMGSLRISDVRVEPLEMLISVKDIVCEIWNLSPRERALTPAELADDGLLFDVDRDGRENLQFDSLDALEIGLRLEEVFGVQIPEVFDPHDISTPARIAAFISVLRQGVGA